MIVWAPAALLLALAIAAFVIYRLQHDASGWIVSAILTILGGAYFIFSTACTSARCASINGIWTICSTAASA